MKVLIIAPVPPPHTGNSLPVQTLVDELKKRTKLDIGVGFSNINRPDQSFENAAEVESPARYGISGHAILTYNDEKEAWDMEGPYFKRDQIQFLDGLRITPGEEDGQ